MDDTILTQDGANGSIGAVRTADIVNEMQGAYLDYAMSVIVARALPDVRDGLKPVHRRILYAMHHDLGLDHTKPHKKSARIVGEVLGKYHPHGDTAVYDAMVRMAQEFSLRYPLIDGQGNFGSVDGDNAAAMRYTEARLAEISDLMLADLEKDTVDWGENFDNSLREPNVLPAALPNLLINGSSGIAVGMATNVPSHNLGEVVDALAYMLDHYERMDDITVEHLMQFVKGPDFPTGGILYRYRDEGKDDESVDAIAQGYSVGRARLVVQAKAHFEEMSRGRSRIVITELPYQVNHDNFITSIAEQVRDGKLAGSKKTAETDVYELAELMVGRKVEKTFDKSIRDCCSRRVALRTRNLRVLMPGEMVHGVDLDIHEGEIFGLGGLAGQGKIGIANGVMGMYPATGQVEVFGEPLVLNDAQSALKMDIAFVSEDRKGVGLLLDMSIEMNIAVPSIQNKEKFLAKIPPLFSQIRFTEVRRNAVAMIEQLDIRCTGPGQMVRRLSGGNQQKVCLAKAWTYGPRILFVSEPTRGIDIGAKKLVLDTLVKMNKEEGITIIMTSSELAELKTICDRIAIIDDGRVAGILKGDDDNVKFGLLMGGKRIDTN